MGVERAREVAAGVERGAAAVVEDGQCADGAIHPTAWHYLKGTAPPPPSWTARTFDDSGWTQGAAAFGYGYGGEGTLLSDMKNGYASVYLRAPFTVADPTRISALALEVSFDDGSSPT